MERVKSGIDGFDDLVQGGFPQGSSVLLAGGTGTCKTIFAMQYIYNGAVQYDEPGLYVTVESNAKNIAWNMESFGWNIRDLQEERKVNIYRLHTASKRDFGGLIKEELSTITSLVKELGVKRLVVDSTTAIAALISEPTAIRNILFKFGDGLKELNCTTLFTSETKSEKNTFSAYGVEEFMADGVIVLYFAPPNRIIFIRKMRGTNHSKNVHPFEIGPKGIVVKPKEHVLWEAIK